MACVGGGLGRGVEITVSGHTPGTHQAHTRHMTGRHTSCTCHAHAMHMPCTHRSCTQNVNGAWIFLKSHCKIGPTMFGWPTVVLKRNSAVKHWMHWNRLKVYFFLLVVPTWWPWCMLNNLAVKYVHLTVVQMLYVYLTIVYGKNDGAHVRSMPKRSLFWQLGRHDHLGTFALLTKKIRNILPQNILSI